MPWLMLGERQLLSYLLVCAMGKAPHDFAAPIGVLN